MLGILLLTPAAHAAAPWCDALAQTIAAPPPIVAQDEGSISVWHCGDSEQNEAVQRGPVPREHHMPTAVQQSSDKAAPGALGWPPPQSGARIAVPDGERLHRPGFSTMVFRPPRS